MQEMGSQRASMKATVARGTDLTTVFSNPGGLARLKGKRFYVSIMPAKVWAKFKLQQEDGTYTDWIEPTKAFGLVPFIGVSNDFGLDEWVFAGSWYCPQSVGIGVGRRFPAALPRHRGLLHQLVSDRDRLLPATPAVLGGSGG